MAKHTHSIVLSVPSTHLHLNAHIAAVRSLVTAWRQTGNFTVVPTVPAKIASAFWMTILLLKEVRYETQRDHDK